MSSQRYPAEIRGESVRQVLERGYTVAEVSLLTNFFCCPHPLRNRLI